MANLPGPLAALNGALHIRAGQTFRIRNCHDSGRILPVKHRAKGPCRVKTPPYAICQIGNFRGVVGLVRKVAFWCAGPLPATHNYFLTLRATVAGPRTSNGTHHDALHARHRRPGLRPQEYHRVESHQSRQDFGHPRRPRAMGDRPRRAAPGLPARCGWRCRATPKPLYAPPPTPDAAALERAVADLREQLDDMRTQRNEWQAQAQAWQVQAQRVLVAPDQKATRRNT